jgi:hypothetical protein
MERLPIIWEYLETRYEPYELLPTTCLVSLDEF